MSAAEEFRLVLLSLEQRNAIADRIGVCPFEPAEKEFAAIPDAWDDAPEDYWSEIADEFKRHRCKNANCFAESVLMRLGALSPGNPLSPFGA